MNNNNYSYNPFDDINSNKVKSKYSADNFSNENKLEQEKKFNSNNRQMDRLFAEREIFSTKHTTIPNKNLGEIPDIDEENQIRGLPIRSQHLIKKTIHDENKHLDFDIADTRPSNLQISSYDPQNSSGSLDTGFADIHTSMVKMSSQINPISVCSSQIDDTTINFFKYLINLFESNDYAINGIGLINLFGTLYLSSDGITELELKKFFGFTKKDIVYKGLSIISDELDKLENMINIKNFYIVGKGVPYDQHYYDNIRKFCVLIKTNDDKNDTNKINMIIKKLLNVKMKTSIVPENLENLQLMFLTTGIFHPIWEYAFDNIAHGIFTTAYDMKYKIDYLHSVGKSFGYFEDSNNQLLEIKCVGGRLNIGFILCENVLQFDMDNIKLQHMITNMKELVMDEIKIPMFTQDSKIRYNNTLKNLGLKSTFINIISPKFFPEGVVLQDVVQNIKIIIDNTSASTERKKNKTYSSSRKFILNKSFIYYFRLVKTNTILLMGMY